MIDIITLGAIFVVLGHDVGGPLECTSANGLCPATQKGDQIKFDRSLVTNSTNISLSTLTSSMFTISSNETIIVTTQSSLGNANVTSVIDTLSTVFTFAIREGTASNGFLEVWGGRYLGSVSATDSVTVTWNTPDTVMFVSTLYKNVLGIGNVNGTASSPVVSSLSTMLTTGTSGSWIFGTAGATVGTAACQNLQSGAAFVQRISTCTGGGGIMDMMTVADNATVLPTFQKLIYLVSASTMVPIGMAEVELLAVDREPNNPNFNNFCTTTNGLCVTTQYSLNQVVAATDPNALNKVLPVGTAFCTGITTAALTASNRIFAWGDYAADDLNTTGAKLLIQLYISSAVPTTAFASGLCATGGAVIATGTISFGTVFGALSATNTFTTALNGFKAGVAGTWYGWFEVTAQNFVGSLNMDQITTQVYGISSLQMQEQK